MNKSLRVMTYNVHGCKGTDGVISTERIARVIAQYKPDVIALQELDVGRKRSSGMDQVDKIACQLEMSFHFYSTFRYKDEQYGNAILSCHPMVLMKKDALPKLGQGLLYEARGALWVVLEYQGVPINIINTHLSLWSRERMAQIKALFSKEWRYHPNCAGPVILCGDFNMPPKSLEYQEVCQHLKDSQSILDGHRPHHTWVFAGHAFRRIDYVFVTPTFSVKDVQIPYKSDYIASDHLPLLVEVQLP